MDTKKVNDICYVRKKLGIYKSNLEVKWYEANINEVLENKMEAQIKII